MPTERTPLRILFSMRHLGSFRMYETVIRELAARGHHVHLVIDRKEKLGWQKGLEQILDEFPTVTWKWAVRQRQVQHWYEMSRLVRIWLDYLRYFGPLYDAAPILRRRAGDLLPFWIVRATHAWPLRTRAGLRALRAALLHAERALPRVHEIDELIREQRPDVMLITPLVYLGSPQVEMLRSAKAFGIPTALCVGSWDHLSSKAVIRDVPHRILVWNETQRTEAVELHGIPGHQVVVTGAQCYDRWFGRSPSRPHAAFCADVGLRPDQPFILYVCSALFWGSPVEAEFVVSWIEALRRSSSERLRTIGILIRPHPARHDEWRPIDLTRFDNVTLYGASPVDHDSRNDYFDSLYHSAAVVGLNTSAFLEAAIVGKPVHTILPPEFADNQEGTLHFRYLMTVGGGLLRSSRDFEQHTAQLLESLAGPADNSAFVTAFIRPAGLDRPATEVFVDTVEQMAAEAPPEPFVTPRRYELLRWLLWPAASLARLVLARDWAAAPADAGGVPVGAAGQLRQALAARRDRLSREVAKRQRWNEKQRAFAEYSRVKAAADVAHERATQEQRAATRKRREGARAEELAQRQARLAQRQARIDRDRQDKERRRAQRRREKSRHSWRKWRQIVQQRILSRLGRT